jgi:hypothetical protein
MTALVKLFLLQNKKRKGESITIYRLKVKEDKLVNLSFLEVYFFQQLFVSIRLNIIFFDCSRQIKKRLLGPPLNLPGKK